MEIKELTNKFLTKDVSGKTEKKKDLTYLSWAYAWAEVLQLDENATYEIKMFEGKPYVQTSCGAMVFTTLTIKGVTREMWLPVLDGANKTMLETAYEYETKYGKKTCDAITMFDVNKTIMRCLVKNIAMFGLGLFLYAGEDLPFEDIVRTCSKEQIQRIKELGIDERAVMKKFNLNNIEELSEENAIYIITMKEKQLDEKKAEAGK